MFFLRECPRRVHIVSPRRTLGVPLIDTARRGKPELGGQAVLKLHSLGPGFEGARILTDESGVKPGEENRLRKTGEQMNVCLAEMMRLNAREDLIEDGSRTWL